jgi:predicted lipoprotein with Yx(FWY)xxD motif
MILRSAHTLLAEAIVALAVLALTACGSSTASTASPQPPKTGTGTPATVGVANTGFGDILVDTHGRTLYLFKKDSGPTSTCTGACATYWPALIALGIPTSGTRAHASLIGTTKRQDGAAQVTYNGHPLYLYGGDHSPGYTNGQGDVAFGAG